MRDEGTPRKPSLTRFARRGFARLAYETRGEGERTVVLVHDLLTDRASLHPVRDALVKSGFRVVLPDLRGHGASAAIPGIRFTVAELVLDLAAVLEAEALARVRVVGVGFGAAIGFDLAVAEPARVERLLLIDPFLPGAPRDDPDPAVSAAASEAREQAASIAELANKGSVDRALDLFYGSRRGPAWRAALSKASLGAMRRHAPAFGPLLTAAFNYRPAATDPHLAPQPALILLTGAADEQDRLGAERLCALLPGAGLEQLTDAATLEEAVVRFLHG